MDNVAYFDTKYNLIFSFKLHFEKIEKGFPSKIKIVKIWISLGKYIIINKNKDDIIIDIIWLYSLFYKERGIRLWQSAE